MWNKFVHHRLQAAVPSLLWEAYPWSSNSVLLLPNQTRLDVVGEKAVQPHPGGPELVHERLHPVPFADFRRVSSGNHPLQSQEDALEEHSENLEYNSRR